MKKYIDQVFYEGLGKSIYCPLEKIIFKISNEKFRNICILFVKCIYFTIALFIAFMLFYFVV